MKLVRDKIPSIIKLGGKEPEVDVINSKKEYLLWLKVKMDEESQEFLQNPCLEEAADVYEVLLSFLHLTNLNLDDVIRTANNKRKKKGSFTKGVLLRWKKI
mgnify:CR=1 FL=1